MLAFCFHCAFELFQSCPPYWPSEGDHKDYGLLQVEHAETCTESENIIIRKFKLKHKRVGTASFCIPQAYDMLVVAFMKIIKSLIFNRNLWFSKGILKVFQNVQVLLVTHKT